MSAVANLEQDEAYLFAILDDPSGIDLAEFCWVDEEPGKEHPCYRLWDFQWALYTNEATFQIDLMGRGLGKTQGVIQRAFAFPFNYPGQEMLLTAPELNHLSRITDLIEEKLMTVRLGREMLPSQKGGGIRHQPQFQASFSNGARIMGRLPQRTGRGVKGAHPLVLEMDEGQDYPERGWIEIIETMKHGTPGAQWRVHGVSRGVRDMYYRMTQDDSDLPFFVHRYPAMYRPTWSETERRQKIAIYGGSRDNPDYRRNIYGEHGDATNPVFVLARLMNCVRINESTWATEYNENIYAQIRIEGEHLFERPVESYLSFPQSHLHQSYTSFWAGMDVGYTNDPSELLVFGQVRVKRQAKDPDTGKPLPGDIEVDVLRLLTRVHMMRVSSFDQERVIAEVFRFYGDRLRFLSMDRTGNGLPLLQAMEGRPEYESTRGRIKGYHFSEKKAVAFDDRPLQRQEKPEDAVIEKQVIEHATDKLRAYVDAGMMELPFDRELLSEWQGQVVVYVRDDTGVRGSRTRYGGGSFHTLDAAKLMILGKELEPIEVALNNPRRPPVLDRFVG